MDHQDILKLLEKFRQGQVTSEDVIQQVSRPPIQHLGFANIDHHRALRHGFPEVVFGGGKTIEQLRAIITALLAKDTRLLATQIAKETFIALEKDFPIMHYHAEARCIYAGMPEKNPQYVNHVGIISGGTSDMPVVSEAELTLKMFGIQPQVFADVGVAGIHRLDAIWPQLQNCYVLIVIVGMEGALPSVVAGLGDIPVIAVPTSQGYGTNLSGFTPLMAMLSSCATGISVVNINNGFGAAFSAALFIRQLQRFSNHNSNKET